MRPSDHTPRRSVRTVLVAAVPGPVRRRIEQSIEERIEPELRLVRALLPRGGVLLDVGANNGAYVRAGLRAGAQVIAVEPQPALAAALAARYGHDRVRVHATAVSGAVGVATLYQPRHTSGALLDARASLVADANDGYELETIVVPTAPLDALAPGRVDVVKVDVEGHEAAVLESAAAILSTGVPAVLVEVERRHHAQDPWRAFDILRSHGYVGWFVDGRTLRPIESFDPDAMQPTGVVKDPMVATKPATYINNFLFLHPTHDSDYRARTGRAFRWLER